MEQITRSELVMALTQYYQEYSDDPENFAYGEGTPASDAEGAANYIFEIIKSNHN